MRLGRRALLAAAPVALAASTARAQGGAPWRLPILVPITGVAAIEGASQRNGALLAVKQTGLFAAEVIDTASSPETALNAWERAMRGDKPLAVVGPILGVQMLAMLPRAQEAGVPILTSSGTARLSELGNPFFFRFFPSDATVKVAHARYAVERLGARRPAVLYQTTAYGQSGREQLARTFASLGVTPVLEEAVPVTANDLSGPIAKALQASADVLVLHLHAGSTALAVRQTRALNKSIRIVAGSAMHQPATAALLEPAELAGVCAETASSPVSAATPTERDFLEAYRAEFKTDPDAFALATYDAVFVLALAVKAGADTPAKMREALAATDRRGLATGYRNDGKGNMAHEALIVCYDGASRVPRIDARYSFPP